MPDLSWVAPFVVAVFIACLLALIELMTRLRYRPRRRGWGWWAARLGLEGVVAIGGVLLIGYLTKDNKPSDWVKTGFGLGFAGGIAGPALIRSRVFTVGKGDTAKEFGLALLYDPVRDFIERQLDDQGSTEQTQWINTQVMPSLAQTNPAMLANWYLPYVNGLSFMNDQQKNEERQFVADVLQDSTSNGQKLEALVNRLVLKGGRSIVEAFIRSLVAPAPAVPPAQPPPPPEPAG